MPTAIVTCNAFPIADEDMALRDALRRALITQPHPAPQRISDPHDPVIDIVPWSMPRVDWSRYDAAIISTPWDYVDHPDRFFTWLDAAEEATTVLNPPATIRRNARKRYLLELQAKGVPTIPTLLIEQHDTDADPVDAANQHGWHDFIIKPEIGAGASGLLRVILNPDHNAPRTNEQTWSKGQLPSGITTSPAVARDHLAALQAQGHALLQPYLPAVERGEVSLIYFNGQFSHAVRKTPRDGDIRVQHEFGGTYKKHTPTEPELALARAAIDAEHAARLPYLRVDCINDADDQPRLIEIELFEPQLFLNLDKQAPAKRAEAILAALR